MISGRKPLTRATLLHMRGAKGKAKETGLQVYITGRAVHLFSREEKGRGGTGTECVTRETLSDLWPALRCGEKAEQRGFRPGSEPSLITVRS